MAAFDRQQRDYRVAEQGFGHSRRYRHGEGTGCDPAAVLRAFCILLVDEERYVIADEGAEQREISFRHRTAVGLVSLADLEIFPIHRHLAHPLGTI